MIRTEHLLSVALACLLLLAVSCSSGDAADENANYASIEDAPTPVETVEPVQSAAADPALTGALVEDPNDLGRVVQVFDSFLSLRAQAITGDIALDELDALATPAAIDQVAGLRAANDDLIARDSYAALDSLAEWSNVSAVMETDTGYQLFDCTERQYLTPGGATVVAFVANTVAMVDDGGTYRIEAVTETQNGRVALSPDELGCVPESFAERAEAIAATAVGEASRLIADPQAAAANGLSTVFAGDARSDLERVLATLSLEGLSRTSDEIVTLSVLGMDVSRPQFTVVVAVCRTYPQGRVFVDSTGAETLTDVPIGSSHEEWLSVQLEPVPSGEQPVDTVTHLEDRGPTCQEG